MRARSRSRRRSRSGFASNQGCRDRRAEAQDIGLHQRLRPSPRWPHRHPRRRPQGHGELPAPARRIGRGGLLARHDHRPRLRRDGIVDAVEKATDLYLAHAPRASASSIPTAVLAWPRSRRRSMADQVVIPAKAGISGKIAQWRKMQACAGMTEIVNG
jgi:hypothetical protein